jgi:DNA-binding response OmpR family regulator
MIHNQTRAANDAYLSLLGHKKEVTKVLIIGNNPLELAEIYDKLSNSRRKYYMVDVSFSLKDGRQRAIKNNPDVILLDDNLEYQDMKSFTREIKSNHKFSHLKIILMKSSNKKYVLLEQVEDYLLKNAINTEMLDNVISNQMLRTTRHLVY